MASPFVGEVINSHPVLRPPAEVSFDVTPHGNVVAFGGYTWSASAHAPAMYEHQVGVQLTFTGAVQNIPVNYGIVDWYWDFGDGTFGSGQVVQKTYRVVVPGMIAHLRTTDQWGGRSYASMNLMLVA